ncbi:MAG: hypothetical protein OJF55_000089 [Rhodanobacteraceae bacterium]|nr:MAG: hypothetical protein OJF55_000089 [Rhodanobacteraceae bacterium]
MIGRRTHGNNYFVIPGPSAVYANGPGMTGKVLPHVGR